jgi:predicted deacylase
MSDMSRRSVSRSLVCVALVLGLAGAGAAAADARTGDQPQVARFTIGTSVKGRPISVVHRAYPGATTKVVVIGSIHGNERAGLRVVRDLRGRGLPRNLDLYLLRTANPDGLAADRRTNAHGVDLNRNFPYRWHSIDRGGPTYSGPTAGSEPETRALRAFVRRLRPALIVTFHQPLYGVGANDKAMPVVRALARGMRLPVKKFSCTGVCYGSFTSWVNHSTPGLAVTVEFGRTVSSARVRRAARTIVAVGSGL